MEAQPALHRLEAQDEDGVEALVWDRHKAARRIESHVVRMRPRLLDAMRPELAGEEQQIVIVGELAVGADREHRDIAGDVVGDDHEAVLAGAVDDEVVLRQRHGEPEPGCVTALHDHPADPRGGEFVDPGP